jgi:hypothetical protein
MLEDSGKIDFHLIHKTPSPVLASLQRLHDRVLGFVKVFRGVFIFRGIAAANVAAFHAKAKVDPGIAGFQAFFASLRGVWLDVVNVIEMGTGTHPSILQLLIEDKTALSLLASVNMLARLLLLVFSLLSLACFAVPMYVIRPFRHQGARELAVALFVKQIGPGLSAGCALMALALVILSWRRMHGWLPRVAVAAAVLLAFGGAYLSRVNVYELMFHPLGPPHFESARDARIDKDDMVIAVRVNGEARAYPIREMAYHHVVNDTVGREPIVSTY